MAKLIEYLDNMSLLLGPFYYITKHPTYVEPWDIYMNVIL